MLTLINSDFQYATFDDAIRDAKARYRRTHKNETEGLYYQFREQRNRDGKSGLLMVDRLESPPDGSPAQDETLVIQDDRVTHNYVR